MTGMGVLWRLYWRRNRVFYLVWALILASFMPLTVLKFHDLVPSGANAAAELAGLANNPTMRAMLGLPFDLSTPGGFTFWRVGGFTASAAGIMSGLGVVRSTRDEEEEGRLDLIRSGAIGRHAPLLAALGLAFASCFGLGVLVAVFMVAAGTPVAGSVAAGLGIALTGAMVAAIAGVVAQFFESARSVRAWSMGLLGGLYLVRALVDASLDQSVTRWSWAMPLDWVALVRPYVHERWWVLLLPLAVTVVLSSLAVVLESRRDLGSALLGQRPGPASASRSLGGAWGLSMRLHRGDLLGWGIGMALAALILGSLSLTFATLFRSQPALGEILSKMGSGSNQMVVSFHTAMLSMLTTLIALAGVSMMNRLRTEEIAGRAELMLSTATSRTRLLASHAVVAIGTSVVLLLAVGVLLPLVQGVHDGSGHLPWQMFQAAAAFVPGVLLVIGLAVALIGCIPRGMALAWAVIGWTMVDAWLFPVLNLPTWITRLQPWGHLPHLPTDPMTWTAVVVETAIAIVLLGVGSVGWSRRHIVGR